MFLTFSSHGLQTLKLTQLLEMKHPRLQCRNIHESVVSACVSFLSICMIFILVGLYVFGNLSKCIVVWQSVGTVEFDVI